jgi:predicted DNA-binding protein with PD1-like motif
MVSDQGPTLHLHAVLRNGRPPDRGNVRPTLEVISIQSPSYLRKHKDPETGLALIDIA